MSTLGVVGESLTVGNTVGRGDGKSAGDGAQAFTPLINNTETIAMSRIALLFTGRSLLMEGTKIISQGWLIGKARILSHSTRAPAPYMLPMPARQRFILLLPGANECVIISPKEDENATDPDSR